MHTPEQFRRNHCQHQADGQRQTEACEYRHHQAVSDKQSGQRPRPGKCLPAFGTPVGQHLWHIDSKFMWRRILASMIAGPAMVAEIGQIGRIPFSKKTATLHCRKDRTKSLTIATGIAYLHKTRCLFMRRHCGQLEKVDVGQDVSPAVTRFSRRAACSPAIRPKTAPMVMPMPARYPWPRILPAMISPAA